MSGGKSVKIDIQEIKTPELDAQLVAENVALQIERRISFRRAMKKSIQQTMDFGAQGIKLRCAGRLGGAEISRAEWYREGKIPLHTLRQPIDYGFAEARTTVTARSESNAGSAKKARRRTAKRTERESGSPLAPSRALNRLPGDHDHAFDAKTSEVSQNPAR